MKLTEQWKRGELEDGDYYVEDYDGFTGCANIKSDKSIFDYDDYFAKVLAQVPTYEELQELKDKLEVAVKALEKCKQESSIIVECKVVTIDDIYGLSLNNVYHKAKQALNTIKGDKYMYNIRNCRNDTETNRLVAKPMTEIKKIELTCQQLFDAGADKIEYFENTDTYCVDAFNSTSSYDIDTALFTITDLPASGVAKKPVDESSWIGKPCWFWDDGDCSFEVLDILDAIDATEEKVYLSRGFGCWFKHCKPATKEEVLEWFTKNGGDSGN